MLSNLKWNHTCENFSRQAGMALAMGTCTNETNSSVKLHLADGTLLQHPINMCVELMHVEHKDATSHTHSLGSNNRCSYTLQSPDGKVAGSWYESALKASQCMCRANVRLSCTYKCALRENFHATLHMSVCHVHASPGRQAFVVETCTSAQPFLYRRCVKCCMVGLKS